MPWKILRGSTNEVMLIINDQTATSHHAWVQHRATSDALKTTPEQREARAGVCYCRPQIATHTTVAVLALPVFHEISSSSMLLLLAANRCRLLWASCDSQALVERARRALSLSSNSAANQGWFQSTTSLCSAAPSQRAAQRPCAQMQKRQGSARP